MMTIWLGPWACPISIFVRPRNAQNLTINGIRAIILVLID